MKAFFRPVLLDGMRSSGRLLANVAVHFQFFSGDGEGNFWRDLFDG
jgi:hypothetical protein